MDLAWILASIFPELYLEALQLGNLSLLYYYFGIKSYVTILNVRPFQLRLWGNVIFLAVIKDRGLICLVQISLINDHVFCTFNIC